MEDNSHATYAQYLIEAVLTSPGDIEPSVRQAVEDLSVQLGGRPSTRAVAVSPELTSYIKKVALNAYKTTDEDIKALREAGFSEDAIFEITVSAALGAGMARLERGLAALKREGSTMP